MFKVVLTAGLYTPKLKNNYYVWVCVIVVMGISVATLAQAIFSVRV